MQSQKQLLKLDLVLQIWQNKSNKTKTINPINVLFLF